MRNGDVSPQYSGDIYMIEGVNVDENPVDSPKGVNAAFAGLVSRQITQPLNPDQILSEDGSREQLLQQESVQE